ncbi:hypothetical protein T484DRAFT_2082998 [Baffinella frigidus]|nr:hypothetical protein T484DRAFT_2082998 [Cryptophyta sp. CCMP2293]
MPHAQFLLDHAQFLLDDADIGADSDDEQIQRCASDSALETADSTSMRRNMTTLNLLVDGETSDGACEEDREESRQFMMGNYRRCGSFPNLGGDKEQSECSPSLGGIAVSWKPTLSQRITHSHSAPRTSSPRHSNTHPTSFLRRTSTSTAGTSSPARCGSPTLSPGSPMSGALRKSFSIDLSNDCLSMGSPQQRRSVVDSPTRLKWPGRNDAEFARGKALLHTLT